MHKMSLPDKSYIESYYAVQMKDQQFRSDTSFDFHIEFPQDNNFHLDTELVKKNLIDNKSQQDNSII